jgi:hypothetical protein
MEWKTFGSYFISNDGKVKRNEKELKPQVHKGYYRIKLCENGKHETYLVHRLVLIAFKGDCPNGHECDHIDRNRLNNHIDNLHWVTRSENMMNRSMTRTDITELDPKKRLVILSKENYSKNYSKRGHKKQNGTISVTKNNRYQAHVTVNKITYWKTLDTKEEAQAFIDSKKNKM